MARPGTREQTSNAATRGGNLPRRAVLLLAALLAASLALAARAEAFVYWSNFGTNTIGRANLDGTGVDQSFVPRADEPCGVAVDASHVYWADTDAVGRANLDGSGADQSFITGTNFPCGVAVDASHVYWSISGPGTSGTIGRANLDGSGADHSFITGLNSPTGVTVDAGHVYWASVDGNAIGRANLDGSGADQSFITGLAGTRGGVAVDASHVYWVNLVDRTIGRANLDGTGVDQSFITALVDPLSVAVDASHVYWTDSGARRGTPPLREGVGTIGRANLDGTGVDQRFICEANAPIGVAVDALSAPPPQSPPNEFSFCEVKMNKKKGTAKLTVKVPGPGELVLARTKKVKGAKARAGENALVKLPVKPKGKAKKKLNKKGTAKVTAAVTYTPDGGEPNTERRKIKLIKR
jgi:virginiamycin B lyase